MTRRVPRERLAALVPRFEGRRLAVAGDYVLDRFVFGHPKRVSREAPVLILRFFKEENLPKTARRFYEMSVDDSWALFAVESDAETGASLHPQTRQPLEEEDVYSCSARDALRW